MNRYRMCKADPAWDASHGGGGDAPLPDPAPPVIQPLKANDVATLLDTIKAALIAEKPLYEVLTGAADELVLIRDDRILPRDKKLIQSYIVEFGKFYDKADTLTNKDVGALIVLKACLVADGLEKIFSEYAPNLLKYIPGLFVSSGIL